MIGTPEPARDLKVRTAGGETGPFQGQFVDDRESCAWFVPVKRLDTKPLSDATCEIGLFGNENTMCRPTTPKWRHTVETLKQRFPHHNG